MVLLVDLSCVTNEGVERVKISRARLLTYKYMDKLLECLSAPPAAAFQGCHSSRESSSMETLQLCHKSLFYIMIVQWRIDSCDVMTSHALKPCVYYLVTILFSMCKTTLEDKTVLNISDGRSLLSRLSVAYFPRPILWRR